MISWLWDRMLEAVNFLAKPIFGVVALVGVLLGWIVDVQLWVAGAWFAILSWVIDRGSALAFDLVAWFYELANSLLGWAYQALIDAGVSLGFDGIETVGDQVLSVVSGGNVILPLNEILAMEAATLVGISGIRIVRWTLALLPTWITGGG